MPMNDAQHDDAAAFDLIENHIWKNRERASVGVNVRTGLADPWILSDKQFQRALDTTAHSRCEIQPCTLGIVLLNM